MPDYETLQLVWWVIIGLLFIGFAVTDGFDMGVGTLLPFIGRTDVERRILINSIAPHWDGNQVWLILAAGAVFAAWPPVYATAFSIMYLPMMVLLFALFFRPVGFDYRSKLENAKWREFWDWGLFVGSALPAFLFGVAFSSLFIGLPFEFDELRRPIMRGGVIDLLHPFSMLGGILSVALLTVHGGVYAQWRTEGDIRERLTGAVHAAALVSIIAFIAAGLWLYLGIDGFRITSSGEVVKERGAWLDIYGNWGLFLVPLVGLAGLIIASRNSGRSPGLAFIGSALAIVGVMLTAGITLFPFIVPSAISPQDSITVYNGTSSEYTLAVMMWAAIVFMPLILGYTVWCYRAMWGRITKNHIEQNSHTLY